MTCIVGVKHNNEMYMGADSRILSGLHIIPGECKKVIRCGEMLIGFTGDCRFLDLISYQLVLPKRGEQQTAENYMFVDFITALRSLLKDHAFAEVDKGKESAGWNFLLIAYEGQFYRMTGDYCLIKMSCDFFAIGCGQDYAIGALTALSRNNKKPDPHRWITEALEVSCQWSAGCAPPYFIEKL